MPKLSKLQRLTSSLTQRQPTIQGDVDDVDVRHRRKIWVEAAIGHYLADNQYGFKNRRSTIDTTNGVVSTVKPIVGNEEVRNIAFWQPSTSIKSNSTLNN